MLLDDKLYQAYLEDLEEIEKFRNENLELYIETPIDSEDPYTKRLIESLAFFGARARLQGVNKISQIHQILFRQYFTYMINPLPAFAMIKIEPSIRFPEKIFLKKGTELLFSTTNHTATFQTLEDISILPISLNKAKFVPHGDQGWRFIMEFSSPHFVTEEIGNMSFYISHLNSFFSSLSVAFAIQRSLTRGQIFYDTNDIEKSEGKVVKTSFGIQSSNRIVMSHVFEQIRSALHFPQQELFIHFDIPPAGKKWRSFTICLDFNKNWPSNIQLHRNSMSPFVVPVANLKRDFADPIKCDGAKDSYPILHPEPKYQYKLHTAFTVAKVIDSGLQTLYPNMLGGEEESFEIDYFKQNIALNMPQAFLDPKTVSIEALWTQPWFSDYRNEEMKIDFSNQQSLGLTIDLVGPIEGCEDFPDDDPQFLARILATKNQNELSLSELLFIINKMKNLSNSFFEFIPKIIKKSETKKYVDPLTLNIILQYNFHLHDWKGEKWEVVALFFRYVQTLLSSWVSSFQIELKIILPMSKKVITINQGIEHELSILARNFIISK